jgi:hypothetical protein
MPPNPICSEMGSAVGTSGTKPDSTDDSDDISQEGEETGECEVIVMGRIVEESTCPSCLRVPLSGYLVIMFISVHSHAT